MDENVKREMLRDFREWAAWERERGYWTREDAADIGAAIDEAIRSDNPEMIESWRFFIQANVEEIRRMKGLARVAYERIVAAIKASARLA